MKADFDFELPVCHAADFPPPRADSGRCLEFIEFNQQIVRENGLTLQVMENRSRPVEAMFEIK
jgi:hypothetical protein